MLCRVHTSTTTWWKVSYHDRVAEPFWQHRHGLLITVRSQPLRRSQRNAYPSPINLPFVTLTACTRLARRTFAVYDRNTLTDRCNRLTKKSDYYALGMVVYEARPDVTIPVFGVLELRIFQIFPGNSSCWHQKTRAANPRHHRGLPTKKPGERRDLGSQMGCGRPFSDAGWPTLVHDQLRGPSYLS